MGRSASILEATEELRGLTNVTKTNTINRLGFVLVEIMLRFRHRDRRAAVSSFLPYLSIVENPPGRG